MTSGPKGVGRTTFVMDGGPKRRRRRSAKPAEQDRVPEPSSAACVRCLASVSLAGTRSGDSFASGPGVLCPGCRLRCSESPLSPHPEGEGGERGGSTPRLEDFERAFDHVFGTGGWEAVYSDVGEWPTVHLNVNGPGRLEPIAEESPPPYTEVPPAFVPRVPCLRPLGPCCRVSHRGGSFDFHCEDCMVEYLRSPECLFPCTVESSVYCSSPAFVGRQ